jgi:predicted RNA-binding protein
MKLFFIREKCVEEWLMCEFTVFKKGEVVFKDVVYARADGGNVVVKDVLGVSKTFKDCVIKEVDVKFERLTLAPAEK